MTKGKLGAIVLAIAMVLALILCLMCLTKIPAGYVGIVYNIQDGVSNEVLSQGLHLVAPTKKVTTYSIGIEQSYLTAENKGDSKKDESFNIPTSDGKTVKVNLEFSYRFNVDEVANTFVQFKGRSGEEIKDTLMNDHYAIIEDLNFTAEELDYDRDKVKEHDEQYEYIQEILKDIENFKQQQAEEDLEM